MRNIVYHQPTGYSPCEYAACVGGFCTKSKIEIEIEIELELKIEKTCWGGLYSLRAAKPQALARCAFVTLKNKKNNINNNNKNDRGLEAREYRKWRYPKLSLCQ